MTSYATNQAPGHSVLDPHILLLGGHGKISQLLTPLLLSRKWNVTSVIRDPAQEETIRGLAPGKSGEGRLNVLVRSLEEIQTADAAEKVIQESGANWIIWSAGAGGRGGDAITDKVDHIAANAFIKAANDGTSPIRRFLMVSYLGSRRNKPSWWNDESWESSLHVNEKVLPAYAKAKIAADEYLTGLTDLYDNHKPGGLKGEAGYAAICLRPGTLSEEKAGKVKLGKFEDSRGKVSRAGVAEVIASLFDNATKWETAKCTWIDLLDGDEPVDQAVERVLKERVDVVEGEDVERMKQVARSTVI